MMNGENEDTATTNPITCGKAKFKKSGLSPVLNSKYLEDELKSLLSSAFKERQTFDHNAGYVINNPFMCCVLDNFIEDEKFLDSLKNELFDQIFHEKNNDLYKFQQSDDLKKISTPYMKAFRKLFCTDILSWMKDMTGIPLTDKIDMTCSRYDFTDVLLCHDDELEGRRIAFILYLVPPWNAEDGGKLDLFSVESNGEPSEVVKSINPCWNRFAFFEVSPVSYHQVAEVLAQDKTRLSINGWFHGPNINRPDPYIEPPRTLFPYVSTADDLLFEWINPTYLDLEIQAQIQEKFENESEIELGSFLKEEKFSELVDALKKESVKWEQLGPPNKRNYGRADEDSLPEIVKDCHKFFQSEAMFLMLSNLTGLRLHEMAPEDSDSEDEEVCASSSKNKEAGISENESDDCETEGADSNPCKRLKTNDKDNATKALDSLSVSKNSVKSKKEKKPLNPRCSVESRRWKHGSYSLVHDTDQDTFDFALDLIMYLNCESWKEEFGGFTSYISKGDDEELLTVTPSENSLALVYRDKDTLKFVKHINTRVNDVSDDYEYFDIAAVYYE